MGACHWAAAAALPSPLRSHRGVARIAWPLLLGLATAVVPAAPQIRARGSGAASSSGGVGFAVPARAQQGAARRRPGARAPGALVATRWPGSPKAARPVLEAQRSSKSVEASGVVVLAGKPADARGALALFMRSSGRVLLGALAALVGLVTLLYVTSGFEACMEAASVHVVGSSPLAAGVIGLAVGALHTFAGPDHLAGLAPLVIGQGRTPLAAFGLGALWGSGHATGQMLLGLGCLGVQIGLLRSTWAGALSQVSAWLIGASLIAIGLLGLNETRKFDEGSDEEHAEDPARRARFGKATYFTGVLHGLSLDALLFITPALALPRLAAGLHITGVAVGTLASMGIYTAVLSRLVSRGPRLQLVSGGASVVAMLLGACILAASFGITVGLPGL